MHAPVTGYLARTTKTKCCQSPRRLPIFTSARWRGGTTENRHCRPGAGSRPFISRRTCDRTPPGVGPIRSGGEVCLRQLSRDVNVYGIEIARSLCTDRASSRLRSVSIAVSALGLGAICNAGFPPVNESAGVVCRKIYVENYPASLADPGSGWAGYIDPGCAWKSAACRA